MDAWWANAKVLKTGDRQTRCLSCHTALPYALARPALRRVLGETSPTTHELRIVETVHARMASSDRAQPYYDHTEDKKVESRGVEAVLNAFVLTNHDRDLEAHEPSTNTRAAIGQLWTVQRVDGAWDWFNFGLEPYEAPDAVFHGATLAAMAIGSMPGSVASSDTAGQAGIARLRKYLAESVGSQRLFNRVWALLAASRLDGVLTPAMRAAIGRDLEARQRPDGGWSLADLGTWRWDKKEAPFSGPGAVDSALLSAADGFATGLVVYALRQSGVAADNPVVMRGQQWLRSQQRPQIPGEAAWAPWRAHSLNYDREHGGAKGELWRRMFMSDLATAFAVLALIS
jgi:squalene-hopene/tetraprenyl-beta-curcumene cyclase